MPNRYCATLQTCIQIANRKKCETKRIAPILGREIGFTLPALQEEVVYRRKELNYFPSEKKKEKTTVWQKFYFVPPKLQTFIFSGWLPRLFINPTGKF